MAERTARGARFVGIDVGAETVKVVELTRDGDAFVWSRRVSVEHDKEPGRAVLDVLADFGWDDLSGASVVGRASGEHTRDPNQPTKRGNRGSFE